MTYPPHEREQPPGGGFPWPPAGNPGAAPQPPPAQWPHPAYGQPPQGQEQPYGEPGQPYGQQRPTPYPGAPAHAPPPYGRPAYGPPPYGQPYGPPAYGQPPSGPAYGNPPAPPRTRRTGLLLSLVLLAVLVAAAAVVLSRMLGTRVLSETATERDVAQQFQEHQGVAITVHCGDTMTLTTGAIYHCQGTTARHERVPITIRVTDGPKALYTWGT